MRRSSSVAFEFLVTKAPPGFASLRNTVQHFDVISRTLVFLDGAKADRSDLAVGQKVTVFFEVLGQSYNAVAKRVMAYSVQGAQTSPSSAMTAVAGNTYEYVKVLPKDSGWRSPKPKKNTVIVRVFPDGRTVQVGWSFWTGIGCRGIDTRSGRPFSYPTVAEMVTALKRNGTFHAVDTRQHLGGTRYHRSEVYGRFAAGGSYAKLRLRQKLDVVEGSARLRCDGRWVSVRAPLRRGRP